MGDTVITILLLAGATAWLSYALVHKDGPYNILQHFRVFVGSQLKENSPLGCTFCTSFWVGLLLIAACSLDVAIINNVIQFFGIIGISVTLRGGYQE